MSAVGIFIFFILSSFIYLIQNASHKEKMDKQVGELGGTVISIERMMFNNGPFFIKGKGRSIYKFEYRVGNEIKEGWVRFGGFYLGQIGECKSKWKCKYWDCG